MSANLHKIVLYDLTFWS